MSFVVVTHQVVGSVKVVSVVRESPTYLAGIWLSLHGDLHTRVNIVVLKCGRTYVPKALKILNS
jgi:hypothetical protein